MGSAQARFGLSPIGRLPSEEYRPLNVLVAFLDEHVRGWNRVSVVESGALGVLFMLNVALGTWLLAVRAGAAMCAGLVAWRW